MLYDVVLYMYAGGCWLAGWVCLEPESGGGGWRRWRRVGFVTELTIPVLLKDFPLQFTEAVSFSDSYRPENLINGSLK